MALLTLRVQTAAGQTTKNAPLTNVEIDNNFINLNTDIQTRVLKAGDSLTGKLTFATSTAAAASARIDAGTAPTTPQSGDIWATSTALFYRLGGTTRQIALADAAGNNTASVTVTGTNTGVLASANMADNDLFRIVVGGTAVNEGFVSFETADDGTEPIHFRQYTGSFATLVRTATILDATGNTILPGDVAINGGDITTSATTASIFNTTATTLNFGGAATTITTGATDSGTFTIRNNVVMMTGTGALDIPVGTTAQRPATVSSGMIRYNTTLATFEGYNGSAWGAIGGGSSTITRDEFTATAGQTSFAVTGGFGAQDVLEVYFNGVLLSPSDYTATTPNIILAVGAEAGDIITIVAVKAVTLNATDVTLANDTANTSSYVTFATNATGANSIKTSANLRYNPSTGILAATDFNSTSDRNLKKDVVKIENGLDVVSRLQGYTFKYKETNKDASGVIAQEIEEVLPHVVSETDGIKNVSYSQIIAYLIESIKEQQQQINSLSQKIISLENK